MDRCKRSSYALLVLLVVSSNFAEAEDKDSTPPAPVPPSNNKTLDATQNSLNRTGSSHGSSTNSSAAGSAVKVPPTLRVPGNSKVPPPPLSPNGTSNRQPPPLNVSSTPSKQSPVPGPPVKPSPGLGSGPPPTNATKNGDGGKKNGDNATSGSSVSSAEVQKCGTTNKTCWVNLVTCLWHPSDDAKQQFLILQYKGGNALKVIVIIQPNRKIGEMTFQNKSIKKIPIPSPAEATHNLEIVLKNGDKTCIAVKRVAPVANFLQLLPTYATRLTPIYGAYAIFLTALIVGGMWTCCKLTGWGRRADAGARYQQLEMGIQTQPTSVVETDAAHGWDQWDDDWDEEEAVSRSSHKQHNENASANGHTTTTSINDGWEDWDD